MEPACAVLKIPPSTYYAAKKREENPSARDKRDEKLKTAIRRAREKKGRKLYGAEKDVTRVESRRDRGRAVHSRAADARDGPGPSGQEEAAAGHRVRLGRPGEAPDLLERDFTASAPNCRWVADITYIETSAGFVYAAFILDRFSRMIAGWQVADTLRAELTLDALEMAVWSRGDRMDSQLVHHSDRGVQYAAIRYTERLSEISAVRSIGRKGNSYDNAAAEALNSLYKKELIEREGP